MTTSPRHALVTGSSSGIGLAIARDLLAQGWRVTGLDIAPPALEGQSGFTARGVDLRDAPTLHAVLDDLLDAGAPNALVHAAGVLRTAPLGALDAGDDALMWSLHVNAATRLADRLLPAMARRPGRCVLIGSRVASGMPGRSQYAATKAALVALARSWAAEVVAQGVTVNVVAPAATDTGMLSDPARASSSPRVPPIGRLIRPTEIAALVRFLLSEDAAAITGQELQICGGSSLNR